MPDSNTTVEFARQALILAVVGAAVVTDLRSRRIPNTLTFPAMAIGLAFNAFAGGFDGLLRALAGLGLGAALFVIPVAFMGRGAGDLKLLAALGAFGGPVFVLWGALATTAAGGVFAAATLLYKRQFMPVIAGMAFDAVYARQRPVASSGIRLPYALPIAVGAVAALVLH